MMAAMNGIKKFRFSQDEMKTILNALDFYSRIWIGQYDNILFDLRFYRDLNKLDKYEKYYETMLLNIRNIILPGLNYGIHGSYGIFSDEIDTKAATAYNMQQVFRYKLAYFNNPEGGLTVDFNKPLPAERDEYPWPEAECLKINDTTYIDISICDEQINIIKDALEINHAKFDCDMVKLFNYYTDNLDALKLAQTLTDEFKELEIKLYYTDIFTDIIAKLNDK